MNRTIILRDRDLKRKACDAVLDTPTDPIHEITIRPYREDKTAEQRKFFHVLCGLAAKEYHTQPWKVKEAVKLEAFGPVHTTIAGKDYVLTRSSESLTRKEYSELINTLLAMAAHDGIYLPPAITEES